MSQSSAQAKPEIALPRPAGLRGFASDWASDQRAFKNVSWGKAMMWIFLLSDTFIFGCFLVAYMTARVSTAIAWPNPSTVFALNIGGKEIPLILIAIMTFVLISSSDGGNRYHQPAKACGGVTTHEVDIIAFAAAVDALIEFLDGLNRVAVAHRYTHQDLQGNTIHGGNITQRTCYSLVPKVFEGCVHHVELNALTHSIGRHQDLLLARTNHRTVITNTLHGTFIVGFEPFSDAIDQRKLTQRRKFGPVLPGIFQLLHRIVIIN